MSRCRAHAQASCSMKCLHFPCLGGEFLLFLFELSRWSSEMWVHTPRAAVSSQLLSLLRALPLQFKQTGIPKHRKARALLTRPPSWGQRQYLTSWWIGVHCYPGDPTPVQSMCPLFTQAQGRELGKKKGVGRTVPGSSASDDPGRKFHILCAAWYGGKECGA